MLCSCTWPKPCSGLRAMVGLNVIAPWTGQLVNNEQAALVTMKSLMGSNESNQSPENNLIRNLSLTTSQSLYLIKVAPHRFLLCNQRKIHLNTVPLLSTDCGKAWCCLAPLDTCGLCRTGTGQSGLPSAQTWSLWWDSLMRTHWSTKEGDCATWFPNKLAKHLSPGKLLTKTQWPCNPINSDSKQELFEWLCPWSPLCAGMSLRVPLRGSTSHGWHLQEQVHPWTNSNKVSNSL